MSIKRDMGIVEKVVRKVERRQIQTLAQKMAKLNWNEYKLTKENLLSDNPETVEGTILGILEEGDPR